MQKYRIEGLSDLVFGLALSIGSLAMINQNVDDQGDILSGMIWFTFGFLIIVKVWVSYSDVMSESKVETEFDFRLNLLLLLLVSIEPYLLYVMGKEDQQIMGFSTILYSVDIGLIMLVLGLYYHRRIMTQDGAVGQDRHDINQRNSHYLVAALFLVSAIPVFWDFTILDTKFRYVLWMTSIIPGIVYGQILPRLERGKGSSV